MAGKVKMKPDGNILVKGSECFYPGPDPRIAVSNVFLIEFDQEREVIWHNTYGNQNYAEIDNDLLVFPDNRIAFSGETNLDYRFRARLFLTDPEGNEIGNLIDEGLGVAEFNKMLLTPEGELYVVGATREHFRDDYIYYLRLTRISYPNTVKKEDNVCPSSFKILSAYPNPFNSMTNVVISVNKHQKLSISVHDISGNYITGWISAILTTGKHTIYWDPNSSGSEIPSGVYNFIVRDKDQLNTIQLIKVN